MHNIEVAILFCRTGHFHLGYNLALIALSNLNNSPHDACQCVGSFFNRWREIYLQRYLAHRLQVESVLCIEKISFFLLLRGFAQEARLFLLEAVERLRSSDNPPLQDLECRILGMLSLSHLGSGDLDATQAIFSMALQKFNHDMYTKSCLVYVKTFLFAAQGEFHIALEGCLEAIELLSSSQDCYLQHISTISAGWYAFLIGNVSQAMDLYKTVFEYGISTANRPLIKMSMELYAAILILSGDLEYADTVLDHLKSPLQTHHSFAANLQPSSIKSSLVSISCVLGKRFEKALPHIIFSCRTLSKIAPVNPICGVYLFFAVYSALEIFSQLSSIVWQNVEKSSQYAKQLKDIIVIGMKALGRCSISLSCLKLLYETCLLKQHICESAISITGSLKAFKMADAVAYSDNSMRFDFSGVASFTDNKTVPTASNSVSGLFSTGILSTHFKTTLSLIKPGPCTNYAFGMYFFHRERKSFCELSMVSESNKISDWTCDSNVIFMKLQRLYRRDNSSSHQEFLKLGVSVGMKSEPIKYISDKHDHMTNSETSVDVSGSSKLGNYDVDKFVVSPAVIEYCCSGNDACTMDAAIQSQQEISSKNSRSKISSPAAKIFPY